jgi:hypothetical protein
MLIRPTVTYASETWVLKENMINKLTTFERKVMRKIFGPTRSEDGYRKIKTNQEINDILKGQNIIGFIKKKETGKDMLNEWPRIIMSRRLRDGNPRLKGQLEDLKHIGKMTFWKI